MSKELEIKKLEKKAPVTTKTLKAWCEQGKRIVEEKLLTEEEGQQLLELQQKVVTLWVNKLF